MPPNGAQLESNLDSAMTVSLAFKKQLPLDSREEQLRVLSAPNLRSGLLELQRFVEDTYRLVDSTKLSFDRSRTI